jgi:hypothetical protein
MMANKVYEIYTNLDPLQLSELASETFKTWLQFALGQQELAGKRLRHPSGRYASAISWRRNGLSRVSILADEDAIPEVGAIEYGHSEIDLKEHMLFGGRSRTSQEGYQYRVLPLRPDQWRRSPMLTPGMMINTISGGRLRRGIGKMWAVPRPHVDTSRGFGGRQGRFVTMSNRPGASQWIIPEFHPYAPGKFLADLLRQEFGR